MAPKAPSQVTAEHGTCTHKHKRWWSAGYCRSRGAVPVVTEEWLKVWTAFALSAFLLQAHSNVFPVLVWWISNTGWNGRPGLLLLCSGCVLLCCACFLGCNFEFPINRWLHGQRSYRCPCILCAGLVRCCRYDQGQRQLHTEPQPGAWGSPQPSVPAAPGSRLAR